MSIRIRADEKAALVEALEGDYASPEAAAGAIFSLCADLLAKRDSYVVRVAWGHGFFLGPIHDKRQAAKVAGLAAQTFSATERAQNEGTGILALAGPARLLEATTGLLEGTPDPRFCTTCTHPVFAHVNTAWVKPKGKLRQPAGCTVTDCTCREKS